MKHFAVIGHPIAHSQSPRIFSWLFHAIRFPGDYVRVDVAPSELEAFIEETRGGDWAGLSVTLPHKERVLSLVDELAPRAATAGAVNTVIRDDEGRLRGDNTDVAGIINALASSGRPLAGLRWLVLGAGGAARAAVVAGMVSGASSVRVLNRTAARADALVSDLAATLDTEAPLSWGRLDDEEAAAALAHVDVVVNATSVGLARAEDCPLPESARLEARHLVLDTVYGPRPTALVERARAAGALGLEGTVMLVEQALVQLVCFTGTKPPPGARESLLELLATPS